jgi:hypothetical protein
MTINYKKNKINKEFSHQSKNEKNYLIKNQPKNVSVLAAHHSETARKQNEQLI